MKPVDYDHTVTEIVDVCSFDIKRAASQRPPTQTPMDLHAIVRVLFVGIPLLVVVGADVGVGSFVDLPASDFGT